MKLGIVVAYYRELQTIRDVLNAFEHIKTPFQVYLVEDCSPVSFQEIIDEYGDKPWFNHLRNEVNRGSAFGFNRGVKAALDDDCDLIAINDSDDIAYPDKFKLQIEAFENDPDLMLLGSAADMVDQDTDELLWQCSHPTDDKTIKRQHKLNSTFVHSTVVYRREVFEKVGFYREGVYMPDYDMLTRVLDAGCKAANLPDVLLRYNIRQDSQSVSRPKKLIRSRMAIQLRYFNLLNIWCYVGLARSCLAYLMPGKSTTQIKAFIFQNLHQKVATENK